MMRVMVGVGCAAMLLLCGCASFVDCRMNRVATRPPYDVDAATRRFHDSLLVADLHADTLMLDRGGVHGIQQRQRYGHLDVPRMIDGNVGIQMLTVATVTPVPYCPRMDGGLLDGMEYLAPMQGWPRATWSSPRARALYQASKWRANTSGDPLVRVLSRSDLEAFLCHRYAGDGAGGWTNRAFLRRPVATILGLEGAHAFELSADSVDADIEARVDEFWDAGFRSFALTHRFNNELAGASEGSRERGLTDLGKRVLAALKKRGAILDLAHASTTSIREVLADPNPPPVWISHTGVALPGADLGRASEHRLTTLEDARAIAKAGGLIGIGIWPEAVGKADAAWSARMITNCIAHLGADAVCLGSDMDGAVTAAFDASGWALLTQELRHMGVDDAVIRKVMGGNVARFLLRNLPEGP